MTDIVERLRDQCCRLGHDDHGPGSRAPPPGHPSSPLYPSTRRAAPPRQFPLRADRCFNAPHQPGDLTP